MSGLKMSLTLLGTCLMPLVAALPPDVAKVRRNLESLEQLYISRLDFSERRQALALIDQILAEVEGADDRSPFRPAPKVTPFETLLAEVKKTPFTSDRLKHLETYLGARRIGATQLAQIMALFTFDSERIDCVKVAMPGLADPDNVLPLLMQVGSTFQRETLMRLLWEQRQARAAAAMERAPQG